MIREIELSEVVSQLLSKSENDCEVYDYNYLRKIGDYVEKANSSYRVLLSKCAYRTFQSRNPHRIDIRDGQITVTGLKSPAMKALIHQYAPAKQVAAKIDKAVTKVK